MSAAPFLGILMLDTRFPRPRGDIGHPLTFAFDVRRRVVRAASPRDVVCTPDERLLDAFVAAGAALVKEGAAAIATSCGMLARWQRELQAALPVPVWSSSLLALADELRGQRCGVITIDAASLTHAHFEAVGADPAPPVEGIAPGSALHRSLLDDLPTLDMADANEQVLAAGRRLRAREPALQALVLECTNLPPYADALRRATGLPVHDIVTVLTLRMARLRG
ncbi:MAG TPA: aspartate/glutamate racemase family protein [Burkholderiaceae bacterium]|nr:aspartate/glutamate racemase family protein [Burkholderiaceae bacterium]